MEKTKKKTRSKVTILDGDVVLTYRDELADEDVERHFRVTKYGCSYTVIEQNDPCIQGAQVYHMLDHDPVGGYRLWCVDPDELPKIIRREYQSLRRSWKSWMR